MKIYKVGGCVRDSLLGIESQDIDYVVVGSTIEEMLSLGFKRVGADFPVFLHPDTGEEYALARKDKKTGNGYLGFECEFSKETTLEEDLYRRDLTINAMALDENDNLIDPYHGYIDLKNKIFRHVSPAFSEDPLRILRVARFMARYNGFSIAPDTLSLMKELIKNGEINNLTAERVWKEMVRALQEHNPNLFFKTLSDCGALSILFKDWNNFVDITYPQFNNISNEKISLFNFAYLNFNLNQDVFIRFEKVIPTEFKVFAQFIKLYADKLLAINPDNILCIIERVDGFRKPDRFKDFVFLSQKIFNDIDYHFWIDVLEFIKNIDLSKITQSCDKTNIKERIRIKRIEELNHFLYYPQGNLSI